MKMSLYTWLLFRQVGSSRAVVLNWYPDSQHISKKGIHSVISIDLGNSCMPKEKENVAGQVKTKMRFCAQTGLMQH
jgi:hypothetical protein